MNLELAGLLGADLGLPLIENLAQTGLQHLLIIAGKGMEGVVIHHDGAAHDEQGTTQGIGLELQKILRAQDSVSSLNGVNSIFLQNIFQTTQPNILDPLYPQSIIELIVPLVRSRSPLNCSNEVMGAVLEMIQGSPVRR